MTKKDTRRKIVNPVTGRKVLMTGETGKRVREQKKRKESRKGSSSSKKAKSSTAPKMTSGGKCKKPIGYGFPKATTRPSASFKVAGKTKGYAQRPSARACFDAGACGPVVYVGKLHVMTIDSLGRPSWKAIG
jgi:hypothetical protein